VKAAAAEALDPFERHQADGSGREGPYQIQFDLQETMQDLVGIVREESQLEESIERIQALQERAAVVGASANREYNPGWHTALDLRGLLAVSEAVARAALLRRESRGAQFREDYPEKDTELGQTRFFVRRSADGALEVERASVPQVPDHLRQVIEENG
jgi:succinate dehydrogenase / fumarate reductase flavoprotein subunit